MESVINSIEYLREINIASMIFRLTLAVICGGMIGFERGQKKRPAGFRTHMLVCLGAALTMIISQYEALLLETRWLDIATEIGIKTDVSRFGAQVINGIGFLGAGTIIVTGHQQVTGMTTAAGLWASACMGLAIGAGFFEGAIIGCVLIIMTITVFNHIESVIVANSKNMNVYVEFQHIDDVGIIIDKLKHLDIRIYDIEIKKGKSDGMVNPNAVLTLGLPKKKMHPKVITTLASTDCIRAIEEI